MKIERKHKIVLFSVVLSVTLSSFGFYAYQVVYAPNVLLRAQSDSSFYIYEGETFLAVRKRLDSLKYIGDATSFALLARFLGWDKRMIRGHYLLKRKSHNLKVLRQFRLGLQAPIRLTFSHARKLNQLPERLSHAFMFSEKDMRHLLVDSTTSRLYGFTQDNFLLMFVPNTYELYWDTSPQAFLDRMHQEYCHFWSASRRRKADTLGLTPVEVGILASIVQAETSKAREMSKVAGVYLNRLRRNIPLSADPTLVYAWNDFSIRRVLNRHKTIQSPYNTYLHTGLPPGPINAPKPYVIDHVLNATQHKYLYFCAKPDFSGYHVFAKTLRQHLQNAKAYQQALNKAKLFR